MVVCTCNPSAAAETETPLETSLIGELQANGRPYPKEGGWLS